MRCSNLQLSVIQSLWVSLLLLPARGSVQERSHGASALVRRQKHSTTNQGRVEIQPQGTIKQLHTSGRKHIGSYSSRRNAARMTMKNIYHYRPFIRKKTAHSSRRPTRQKPVMRPVVDRSSKQAQFQLHSSVGRDHLKIPQQVFLTGKFSSFSDALQQRPEMLASLGITPDLRVRYLNDTACRSYLQQTNPELVAFFNAEDHGSYRGDICRASVLAKEGGFYVDMDMQLRVPLTNLIDDETTFLTARSYYGGCLNAIIATVPNSPVMLGTLAHIRKWYGGETSADGLLGPTTMQRGIEDVMKQDCPEHTWDYADAQFKCGTQHAFHIFTEQPIAAQHCRPWGSILCPQRRADSQFEGLKFGLFDRKRDGMESKTSPSEEDIAKREAKFIGWSRFDGCTHLGCGFSGGKLAS